MLGDKAAADKILKEVMDGLGAGPKNIGKHSFYEFSVAVSPIHFNIISKHGSKLQHSKFSNSEQNLCTNYVCIIKYF